MADNVRLGMEKEEALRREGDNNNDNGAEILGDPYSKKSPLPIIGDFTPLSYPDTEYLASQEYSRDIPLATIIQE